MEKGVKLTGAKIRNFGGYKAFECEFNGDVTYLYGFNGAGKTTLALTGLWACVKGVAERQSTGQVTGERFRFIGDGGASADLEYRFIDERTREKFAVQNHMTAGTNAIKVVGVDGSAIGKDKVSDFLNVSLMSAKNFIQLSGQQQALELGIDTSEHDAAIVELKQDATIIGREIKAMGTPTPVEECEAVDVADLLKQKEVVKNELNALYIKNRDRNAALRKQYESAKEALRTKIGECETSNRVRTTAIECCTDALETLIAHGYEGKECAVFITSLPRAEIVPAFALDEPTFIDEVPSDEKIRVIDEKISAAQVKNESAAAYKTYKATVAAIAVKMAELHENHKKQDLAVRRRVEYVNSFDFGFDGLTTTDSGELVLNGRPIKEPYFSRGELEVIVARLHSHVNPALKLRFIDDFNLVDDANQEKIINGLLAEGFQVIVALVGESTDKENAIVLRNCKQVDGDGEKPKLI